MNKQQLFKLYEQQRISKLNRSNANKMLFENPPVINNIPELQNNSLNMLEQIIDNDNIVDINNIDVNDNELKDQIIKEVLEKSLDIILEKTKETIFNEFIETLEQFQSKIIDTTIKQVNELVNNFSKTQLNLINKNNKSTNKINDDNQQSNTLAMQEITKLKLDIDKLHENIKIATNTSLTECKKLLNEHTITKNTFNANIKKINSNMNNLDKKIINMVKK